MSALGAASISAAERSSSGRTEHRLAGEPMQAARARDIETAPSQSTDRREIFRFIYGAGPILSDIFRGMPNQRSKEPQGGAEYARRAALETDSMTPTDAARIICQVHTLVIDGRVWVDVSGPPDFTKIDGNAYHAAWRLLRRFGGLD
jgi:hypothetical protein